MTLLEKITAKLGGKYSELVPTHDMPTLEISADNLLALCEVLKNDADFSFEQLIDLCGVDYSKYGLDEWRTESTTNTGFSRAKDPEVLREKNWGKPRFAVVYHFLSLTHNHRIRLRAFVDENTMTIPSVLSIWDNADWYEREAFDLFGIIFAGHKDLRRILTDYGFVGHPFRKDFPLIGKVEMRYDAREGKCVYGPVSIQPRVLVPKVIRDDSRYETT